VEEDYHQISPSPSYQHHHLKPEAFSLHFLQAAVELAEKSQAPENYCYWQSQFEHFHQTLEASASSAPSQVAQKIVAIVLREHSTDQEEPWGTSLAAPYQLVEESFHPDSQEQEIPDSESMFDLGLELE
jgi:hypothetical protein